MNWFTNDIVSNRAVEEKGSLINRYDGCEHVIDNPEALYTVSYENDSMGREGYCMCKECWDDAQAEVVEETHWCVDCNQPFKLSDGILWKWYDFYAPQGDEPLPVCNCCKVGAKHVERCERDLANSSYEFPDY